MCVLASVVIIKVKLVHFCCKAKKVWWMSSWKRVSKSEKETERVEVKHYEL